jgi:hypothetical protein
MSGQATVNLNDIARADASPAQAREALLGSFGQPTPTLLRDTYLALRAWVWKALDQRRRDPELRDWNDILGAVSSLMAKHGQPSLGERLSALHELISESIASGERHQALDVTRRQHVTQALAFLAESGGNANRSAIGARLGLAQANLTRVLNLMLEASLIERTTLGKEALFALSRTGMAAARSASEVSGQY